MNADYLCNATRNNVERFREENARSTAREILKFLTQRKLEVKSSNAEVSITSAGSLRGHRTNFTHLHRMMCNVFSIVHTDLANVFSSCPPRHILIRPIVAENFNCKGSRR